MKKNILIIGILLGTLVAVSSCKKKCQTCTTTITQLGIQTSKTTQQYCGAEYDDAPNEGTIDQILQSVTIECEDN